MTFTLANDLDLDPWPSPTNVKFDFKVWPWALHRPRAWPWRDLDFTLMSDLHRCTLGSISGFDLDIWPWPWPFDLHFSPWPSPMNLNLDFRVWPWEWPWPWTWPWDDLDLILTNNGQQLSIIAMHNDPELFLNFHQPVSCWNFDFGYLLGELKYIPCGLVAQ